MNTRHCRRVAFTALVPLIAAASCVPPARMAIDGPVTATTTRPTDAPRRHYTYVLVHGAWAGGWQWKGVADRLAADGHVVYRPTMTGMGEREHLATASTDLATHIQDVVNVIRWEELRDVVLVGHSYGGMVVTGVADRVPDRVAAVVYVDAMVPRDGESVEDLMGRTTTAKAPPDGNGPIPPWRWPPHGEPPYEVPQPRRTFNQPIALTNPAARHIPTTYILTVDRGRRTEDDAFYRFYQRAQDRKWEAWVMEGDHVIMRSHPAELTRLLEAAPAAAKAGN